MSAFVTDLLGKTLALFNMREHAGVTRWRQLGTGIVRACALADGKLTVTLEVVDGDPFGGSYDPYSGRYTAGDLVTIEPMSCEHPTKFRVVTPQRQDDIR